MVFERPSSWDEINCEQKLSVIADEMQKHLVVIQGCCEIIRQQNGVSEIPKTMAETIQIQVERLEELRQMMRQR